ncbi:hypothetical protein QE152_g11266 [Popillia japonica]|uniref:Uncharacterized protein n=1 Tax=Popillia japonica TaxID=7064 RepID=A0AAW1LSQ6_POPJA
MHGQNGCGGCFKLLDNLLSSAQLSSSHHQPPPPVTPTGADDQLLGTPTGADDQLLGLRALANGCGGCFKLLDNLLSSAQLSSSHHQPPPPVTPTGADD